MVIRLTRATVVASVIGLGLSGSSAAQELLGDLSTAKKRAADAGRHTLVFVTGSDWEEASKRLVRELLRSFEFLEGAGEIGELVLNFEKKKNKDPRAAYGAMMEQMADLVRSFRDLPGRNVYFSAKMDKTPDEMGKVLYSASMPGKSTARDLPYFFDEVFALRTFTDDEGKKSGALFTSGDDSWSAKDRSGKLEQWEAPDLGAVIGKIGE